MVGQFSGYLSPVFPSQITVDVTEYCNLACIHCPYETVTKLKGRARQHLSPQWHTKLIDEIVSDGQGHCRYVRYTGDGEPLAHPGLADLIAYAHDRSGIPINLTTNGMLLTEDRAEALLDAGVDVFDISIDANTQETYARVRVKGKLDITRANVLRLIEMVRERPGSARVMVSFVEQPLNAHEADDFRNDWRAAGADFVVVRRPHSCAGSIPAQAKVLWDAAPAERRACLYPWERLTLKADGSLSYCPTDWRHEAEIGHIAATTVRDVWQGPGMEAVRLAHTTGDFSGHGFCGKCPDWSVVRWPSEGRSYASVMHEFSSD